jgi:hypothetical protein
MPSNYVSGSSPCLSGLIRALGLPTGITSLTLTATPDGLVTLTTTQIVTEDQIEAFQTWVLSEHLQVTPLPHPTDG